MQVDVEAGKKKKSESVVVTYICEKNCGEELLSTPNDALTDVNHKFSNDEMFYVYITALFIINTIILLLIYL